MPTGSYESWFKKDIAELDWSKPVADNYNVIRAANPAPGAWTMLKGVKLDIYDAARVDGSGKPGAVLAISDAGHHDRRHRRRDPREAGQGAGRQKDRGRRMGEVRRPRGR